MREYSIKVFVLVISMSFMAVHKNINFIKIADAQESLEIPDDWQKPGESNSDFYERVCEEVKKTHPDISENKIRVQLDIFNHFMHMPKFFYGGGATHYESTASLIIDMFANKLMLMIFQNMDELLECKANIAHSAILNSLLDDLNISQPTEESELSRLSDEEKKSFVLPPMIIPTDIPKADEYIKPVSKEEVEIIFVIPLKQPFERKLIDIFPIEKSPVSPKHENIPADIGAGPNLLEYSAQIPDRVSAYDNAWFSDLQNRNTPWYARGSVIDPLGYAAFSLPLLAGYLSTAIVIADFFTGAGNVLIYLNTSLGYSEIGAASTAGFVLIATGKTQETIPFQINRKNYEVCGSITNFSIYSEE